MSAVRKEMKKTGTKARKDPRDPNDFTPATKELIARRAAYRCVVPGCTTPTVGPGAKSTEVASVGTACHIHSAGLNGPRGRGGLGPEELRHPDNGVWACGTHGRLIDANRGDAYPVGILRAWKRLQEAQLKAAMDHQSTNVGWIAGLKVMNGFLFAPDETLELGKATLIQGESLGKTALCDWVAASLGVPVSPRWLNPYRNIITRLVYHAPGEHVAELSIDPTGAALSVDGRVAAEAPRDAEVVVLPERYSELIWKAEADDEAIAKVLRVDPSVARNLVRDIARNGTVWGRSLAFHDEPRYLGDDDHGEPMYHPVETVAVLRRGGPGGVPFATLSGSEETRVLIEFAAALARERSVRRPTLLILDGNGWNFDEYNLEICAEYLPEQPFQTLFTMRGGWEPKNPEKWREWTRLGVARPRWSASLRRLPW